MAAYTKDELEEFQEAFNLFDDLGDGKIPLSQVGECLGTLDQNPTKTDINKCLLQFKPDERISFDVFLTIYQTISKISSGNMKTSDDFIVGLSYFDKDNDGYIPKSKLRHLLTTMGEKMTEGEVEELLAITEDKNGNINYEEFVRKVMDG